MIIRGVDTAKLPDQFHGFVQGRTLILDGDGPCYEVAATVKRLDTAVRHFHQKILTQMFLVKAENCLIHLTASGSHKAGRYNVKAIKPYQGQRKDKPKPALLEPLRQAVALRENWLPEYEVTLHHLLEADDGMIMDAYRLKEFGVIWSADKDLRMTPYPYWEASACTVMPGEPMGKLFLKATPSGTMKLLGQGPLFFWAQMLMGDTADHIAGLTKLHGKLCGPVAAYEYLQDVTSMHDAADRVLDAYRAIDQNPLPEGWLLWLLRWEGDNFWHYVTSLNISDNNRRYLDECSRRDWFSAPAVPEQSSEVL